MMQSNFKEINVINNTEKNISFNSSTDINNQDLKESTINVCGSIDLKQCMLELVEIDQSITYSV